MFLLTSTRVKLDLLNFMSDTKEETDEQHRFQVLKK